MSAIADEKSKIKKTKEKKKKNLCVRERATFKYHVMNDTRHASEA